MRAITLGISVVLVMMSAPLQAHAATPSTVHLTVHYQRPADDYTSWNLWLWKNIIVGNDQGTDTQDAAFSPSEGSAFTGSDSFGKVIDYGANRATAAGKIFEQREDWRIPQPWQSSRVARFSEAEFVKDFRAEMDNGGLKLFDKETNRYATAVRYDKILKKA